MQDTREQQDQQEQQEQQPQQQQVDDSRFSPSAQRQSVYISSFPLAGDPTAEVEENMEADGAHDHDSTFGGDVESLASSTTSLRSAITAYHFEHGRRYHAYQAGRYAWPNDEEELERMDIEHHNVKLQLDGRLFMSPLPDHVEEILDLGTGTGIWAIEVADMLPGTQVVGTDLSPVQPGWLPPNCHFEVDDFDHEWTFGDNRFDMIHQRYLVGSSSSWPTFYERAYRALKPGGWMEVMEIEFNTYCDDATLAEDSALNQWSSLLQDAFEKMERQILAVEDVPDLLAKAGFENIQFQTIKRPMNDWPKDPKMKEIGMYCCLNFLQGLEGFTIGPFTRLLGWEPEEVQVFLAKVRKETVSRRIHSYHKSIICWAQKPVGHATNPPGHPVTGKTDYPLTSTPSPAVT